MLSRQIVKRDILIWNYSIFLYPNNNNNNNKGKVLLDIKLKKLIIHVFLIIKNLKKVKLTF